MLCAWGWRGRRGRTGAAKMTRTEDHDDRCRTYRELAECRQGIERLRATNRRLIDLLSRLGYDVTNVLRDGDPSKKDLVEG